MRTSSVFIAIISSSFGGYLCYIGQYDAGAAMFGAAIASLALSSSNSDSSEVQDLKTRNALLEQELSHQNQIAQRDLQIALLESRLERLDQIGNITQGATIEEERRNLLSEAREENTIEEEEEE